MNTTENPTAVRDLFSNPDFVTQFGEWQYLGAKKEQQHTALFDSMVEARKSDNKALNDTYDDVSYIIEMTEDITDDEFERRWDFLDESELEVLRHKRSTAKAEEATREGLLELGNMVGLGQFATYGLWLYMGHSGHRQTLPGIERQVRTAEERLTEFTTTVAKYAGEKALSVELFGAWAGRLTGDEAKLVRDYLRIPTEQAYGIAFHDLKRKEIGHIYEESFIGIQARDIINSEEPIIEFSKVLEASWLSGLYGRRKLIIGEIPEGPLDLSSFKKANDAAYYAELAERALTVTKLVA